jgi:hypothetical protein
MKLIIAGGRDITLSIDFIDKVLEKFNLFEELTEIISGGANGVDESARAYSEEMIRLCGDNAPIFSEFGADWVSHGKAAGPIRNKEMANYGNALLLIWDGESKGSKSMKKEMLDLDKPIYEVILKKYNV